MRLFKLAGAALIAAAGMFSAGTAQAFNESNAGVYTVLNQQTGEPTQFAYRFYVHEGKWVGEERAPDGSWSAFKCDKDCEIKPLADADMPKQIPGLDQITPSCLANSNFAVCSYLLKKEAKPTGQHYMLVLNTPKGKVVLLMAFTAPL
ncbi:MAG TPA: hypothetical protein VGN52_15250 [Burkholderiales bacterium]